MEKTLKSQHKLLTDYSKKGKIKTIIIGWVIFLTIYGVTRIPDVQHILIQYTSKSTANFVIHGAKFVFIPMIIGTFFTYLEKHTFDELYIYDTGIGFINNKTNTQKYADYADIDLSYGRLQQSFYIAAKTADVKNLEYAWKEFTQPDVLQKNLEHYGKWQ